MSRKRPNETIEYTIGEKIAYYENELKKKHNSQARINAINRKLKQLYAAKRKYGVVYMEDERFFRKSTRDGHHYIISDIDFHDDMTVHRITHHAQGNKKLSGFKDSYLQKDPITHDRKKKRLNANDAYVSSYIKKVDSKDKALIDSLRKKK